MRADNATGSILNGVQTAGLSAISYGSYSAAGTLTVNGQLTGSGTFSGTISNIGGNLGGGQVIGTNAGLIVGATTQLVSTVILNNSSSNNNYTGDTWITNKGILQTNAINQLPSGVGTGDVYLTGTLNMQGFSQAIGGLSGAGTLDGVSGTPTLTIGGNDSTGLTFTGVIKNTAGTLSLVKTGSGTQTINSATANTFTGSITANAGTLVMQGSNSFTGSVNANSGGTVSFANTTAGNALGNSTVVNLNGGSISYTATGTTAALNRSVVIGSGAGTINVASSTSTLTAASVTSTGGNLVKTGPGTFSISGATTLNGGNAGVQVSGGMLQASFGTNGISTINVGAAGYLSLQNNAADVLTLQGVGTNFSLTSGANLGFELAATGTNDRIVYNTAAVTSGSNITLNFSSLVGFGGPTSSYTLITSSTTGGLTGVNFGLGTAPNGYNYTILNDGTTVSLTTAAYTPTYWNNTQTDGSWSNVTGNLGSIGGGAGTNFTSDLAGANDIGHAPAANETVIFNTTAVAGPSITTTLDGNQTIDSVQFIGGGTPAVTSVTINQGSSGTLTLMPASASGGINILTGGGSASIGSTVTLDNTLSPSQTWNVTDSGSTLNISGNVAFGANLNKTGAGALTLSGTNSGSGNITLAGGKLNINSATALGSGSLTINAGTTIDSTTTATLTNVNAETWNGDFTFAGSTNLGLGTGAVTLANSLTVTTTANTLTVGGAIGGSGIALTKAGAGTLVLNGATNTYSGLTTVNGGVLTLNASNTTGGGVTVTSGTLNIGSLSAVSGALTIAGGTTIDNTGSAGTLTGVTGTAINGNFTFTGTNSLNLGTADVTFSTTPTITTTGAATTLTLGGDIQPTANGITKAGAGGLTLAGSNSFTGAVTVNGGTLTLSGVNMHTGATSVTAGTLSLTGSLTANTAISTSGTGVFSQSSTGVISGTNTTFTQGSTGTSVLAGTNTYKGNTTINGGVLTISSTGSLNGNGTTAAGSTLAFGGTAANTVINIAGNITNYFAFSGASVNGANSVYNQTGGTVNFTNTGTAATTNSLQNGQNTGYGYMNITGGTTVIKGRFQPAGGGTGVIYIGGTGKIDNTGGEWLLMSYGTPGTTTSSNSSITLGPGGILDRTGAGNNFGLNMDITNSYAVLNVAGGTVMTTTKPITFGNGASAARTGTSGYLNLAAGKLTLGTAMLNGNTGAGSTGTSFINFAGGKIETNAGVAAIIPASVATQSITTTIFGAINNSAATGDTSQNFTGGLTFDTLTFNSSLTNVLNGASGTGVTQADINIVNGGSGYIGAPMVKFSTTGVVAGGTPAAGYAVLTGGVVTGIVITDPGTYTSGTVPTITLIGGGAGTAANVTVPGSAASGLITANANTGGLTKLGSGTLTLTGANTFGGAVDIQGGMILTNNLAAGLATSGIGNSSNAATNLLLNSSTATTLAASGGGILGYNGTTAVTTFDRNFTLNNVSGGFDASGTTAGTFTLTAANVMTVTPNLGAATLTLQGSGTGAAGAGSIGTLIGEATGTTVALSKFGTGTWNVTNAANTYNGPTTISGGILTVPTLDVGGVPSTLGQSSSDASNLVLNGGSLGYNGTVAGTTDRNFTFAATNSGFDASGTTLGTFTLTAANAMTVASGLGAGQLHPARHRNRRNGCW